MQQNHYHLLAALFEYPDAGFPQRVREVKDFLDGNYCKASVDLDRFLTLLPGTDLLTMQEHIGAWAGKAVAWIGDGNNMANSWINAAGTLGFELRLACPEGYEPDRDVFERNKDRTSISITEDLEEAVAGAHVVTTDVWASMGQEADAEVRRIAFQGYLVDDALMAKADDDAIFLHCLPAHRGEEVAASVIDGPQSRVWDEAENRLHVQKALMAMLLET